MLGYLVNAIKWIKKNKKLGSHNLKIMLMKKRYVIYVKFDAVSITRYISFELHLHTDKL